LKHSPEAHGNGPILEDHLLADAGFMAAVENHGSLSRTIEIVNTDRSVGARFAGEIAQRHGNRGFKGQLNLNFRGAAGQSFAAFLVQGMTMRLEGEANDYVGKGMNSGRITLVPGDGVANPGDQVILGNTCLYGATGGELFAHGRAGERFGVRNSGAHAVVEGAGDHCCEYMTGGVIVVLGGTGRNVGAGMTGGVAFLLDEAGGVQARVNPEIVEVVSITTPQQESLLKSLLEAHVNTTSSEKAKALLSDWTNAKSLFKLLVPPSERAAMGLEAREVVAA
ncbi:glutamate synthase subunit alpha, partial [Synechococcus sp. AH-603-M21]|nr:glutamate synthase subunit alpha [Synechococcus sp. AH-603-M21]